ncbi:response regulator [Kitasatospora sp. NPDC127111]|uniref:response regulator n=1 Tax=Kitasatospora sp. NPDC127111 TaxID=3345363 RepID=UPI00362F7F93
MNPAAPVPASVPATAPAAQPHILIVEDDEVIREATRMALERYGFPVSTAADGLEGLEAFHAVRPDLMLLDVMLPLLDGVGLCRRIREESQLPILMMSARTDPVDVVSGLEAGADDYVVKPFESAVLVARIRTVLRRVRVAPATETPAPAPTAPTASPGQARAEQARAEQTQAGPARTEPAARHLRSFDGMEVDTESMEVRVHGRLVPLTPTELRLLLEFTAAPGIVLERSALLERVWDYDWGADTRVVDVHVQRLRAKIGSGRIETVRGFGYKLRRPA